MESYTTCQPANRTCKQGYAWPSRELLAIYGYAWQSRTLLNHLRVILLATPSLRDYHLGIPRTRSVIKDTIGHPANNSCKQGYAWPSRGPLVIYGYAWQSRTQLNQLRVIPIAIPSLRGSYLGHPEKQACNLGYAWQSREPCP